MEPSLGFRYRKRDRGPRYHFFSFDILIRFLSFLLATASFLSQPVDAHLSLAFAGVAVNNGWKGRGPGARPGSGAWVYS